MRVLTFSAYGIGRLCAAIPSVRERLLAYLPSEATRLRAADCLSANAGEPPALAAAATNNPAR